MSTATIDARVRGYAEAVRLHLADLGPDVVDELADGLEADLAEAVTDRGLGLADDGADPAPDLASVFGTPQQYAAELRAAAGLPEAGAAAPRDRGLHTRLLHLRDGWRRTWEPLTSSPAGARLREFLVSLRPFGWVARGWIIAAVVDGWMRQTGWSLVPRHGVALFWFLVAVVISVQWGRGRWMPWRGLKALAVTATVIAVVGVIPLADSTINQARYGWQSSAAGWQAPQSDGVFVDGERVQNLFPFDAEGRPLENVQLFDERGRPVVTQAPQDGSVEQVQLADDSWGWLWGTVTDDGRLRWNIFPLRQFSEEAVSFGIDGMELAPGTEQEPLTWPFRLAPAAVPVAPTEDETVGDDAAEAGAVEGNADEDQAAEDEAGNQTPEGGTPEGGAPEDQAPDGLPADGAPADGAASDGAPEGEVQADPAAPAAG